MNDTVMDFTRKTTVHMAGALAAVANGASAKAAAEAHHVNLGALYKALRRHGIGGARCPTCGRLLPVNRSSLADVTR